MVRYCLFLIATLPIPWSALAQTEIAEAREALPASRSTRLLFDVNAMVTPALGTTLYGSGMDLRFEVQDRWITGLHSGFAYQAIPSAYGTTAADPIISLYDVGWINTWLLVNKAKWRAGLALSTGMQITSMGDNADKVSVRTRYGYTDVPNKVAVNALIAVEPGVEAAVRLFGKGNPDLWLTARSEYRSLIGGMDFATTSNLRGVGFFLGISLTGDH